MARTAEAKVRETLYGPGAARSKLTPMMGPFTERSWNLMQVVEADAYVVDLLPKGYVEGGTIRPLHVAIRRDFASGVKTGIGFSQGSETGAAYRGALFCEAIPKVEYCRFLGIVINEGQWPSRGVSPHDITDRGPGATSKAGARTAQFEPVVKELSVAYSGQSKAVVESSHPKSMNNVEAPSYLQSDCTAIELARRAVFELLAFNDSCDVSDRIDPSLERHVLRATPNEVWRALDARGRNDAVSIDVADAVRCYLDPVPAKLGRSGVELAGRNYFSKSAKFVHAREQLSGNQRVEIKVYVLEICVRHVWMEWQGELLELDVRYPVQVNEVVKYMSMAEAVEYAEHLERERRNLQDHRRAVGVEMKADYEKQIGKPWDKGTRKTGRRKTGTADSKRESAEARKAVTGGKRAA